MSSAAIPMTVIGNQIGNVLSRNWPNGMLVLQAMVQPVVSKWWHPLYSLFLIMLLWCIIVTTLCMLYHTTSLEWGWLLLPGVAGHDLPVFCWAFSLQISSSILVSFIVELFSVFVIKVMVSAWNEFGRVPSQLFWIKRLGFHSLFKVW